MASLPKSRTDPESLAELRADCEAIDPWVLGRPAAIELPDQREAEPEVYEYL